MFQYCKSNIFLFIEKSEIRNFADDNIIYPCGKDLPKMKEDLISSMKNILKWFRLNPLKPNPGKFKLIMLGDKTCHKHILKMNLTSVQSSDDVAFLGVMIDKNLTFKKRIINLIRKVQYKLHSLPRIRKFLTIENFSL